MALAQTVVYKRFLGASGAPLTGAVIFTLNELITNPSTGDSAVAVPRMVPLDLTGSVSVSLVANRQPGVIPTDSFYLVEENITGSPVKRYKIMVPVDEGDQSLDVLEGIGFVPIPVEGPSGPQGPQGPAGPQGPQGLQGSSGASGVSFYRHVQGVAASTWTVEHGLGYKPGGVFAENSAHDEIVGVVTHLDTNTLTIDFFVNGVPAVESGEAHIS